MGGAWQPVGWTNYNYDLAGEPENTLSMNGATTSTSYSGEQMQSETDASGVTVAFTYDVAGRPLTSAKTSGPTTTYAYDAADRLFTPHNGVQMEARILP